MFPNVLFTEILRCSLVTTDMHMTTAMATHMIMDTVMATPTLPSSGPRQLTRLLKKIQLLMRRALTMKP